MALITSEAPAERKSSGSWPGLLHNNPVMIQETGVNELIAHIQSHGHLSLVAIRVVHGWPPSLS